MNERTTPPSNEQETVAEAAKESRYHYFLTERETVIVERWKQASDCIDPDFEAKDPAAWEAAQIMCGVWIGELKQLAADYPERAAVLVAEILRLGDAEFALHTSSDLAMLAVASSRRDLAEHLWELMREKIADQPPFEDIKVNLEECTRDLIERSSTVSPEAHLEPDPPFDRLDRAAVALFYMDCIAPYLADDDK